MYNLAKIILDNKSTQDAIIYMSKTQEQVRYTYKEINESSNQVANLLKDLGIDKGDRVVVYANKSPQIVFMILGILKIGAIYCPIFSSSGGESLLNKIEDCKPKAVITEAELIQNIRSDLADILIEHIIVTNSCAQSLKENEIAFNDVEEKLSKHFDDYSTCEEDIATIHYTSGTTSTKSKGVVHIHKNIERYIYTMKEVFSINPEDIFWCTADFAWITGTVYGILAPLGVGATIVITENQNYSRTYVEEILITLQVKCWYTAPTLLRILMREEKIVFQTCSFNRLKDIFSVGELLNEEVIDWGEKVFGKTIKDTWFQSETGSIMIANCHELPMKKGSMGKPLPDIEVGILDEFGIEVPNLEIGSLCIRSNWQSMFKSYWRNKDLYNQKFSDGWYYTGDLAYKDTEGYIWFYSREDDVINTAGHLVNPLEIESSIRRLENIKDVAVVGVKDDLLGEKIKMYISLNKKVDKLKEVERNIKFLVRKNIASYAVPQIIELVEEIPKTNSGKIIRRK